MVFGDPNEFAILVEKIPEWTAPNSYENGMFHFIIDAKVLPDNAGVATLGGDIFCLSENNALVDPPDDKDLFDLPKQQAFMKMLNSMLPEKLNPDAEVPEDFETDYKYQASTYNLEANNCFVFAVSSGSKIRILGAKVSYLIGNDTDGYTWKDYEKLDIYEIILEKKRVLDIVKAVKAQVAIRPL